MVKYLNLLDKKKYAGKNIMDYPSSFYSLHKGFTVIAHLRLNAKWTISLQKKQPTLSAHIITNLYCDWHIYSLIAYLCSTFARGWASAGGVKWMVANLINGGELGILRLKPLTFLLSCLMKVINTSVIRTYTVGTD